MRSLVLSRRFSYGLATINLIIGVFNLLPAFPLDGGRVLRSILWGMSGDLRTSTRRVSAIGQLFGWMFIVTGIAMTFGVHVVFFGTGLAGGMWLAFIGWFLHTAASQSYRRLALDDAFAGHTVAEIMRPGGPTVNPEVSLAALVHDYLVRSDEHALAVMRDGQLVGLVSLTDVRGVPPADWPTTPVSRVMRPGASLTVATPEEPVAQAFEQLAQQNVEQLPVLDHGRLVGMLQRRDIARWLELAWGRRRRGPIGALVRLSNGAQGSGRLSSGSDSPRIDSCKRPIHEPLQGPSEADSCLRGRRVHAPPRVHARGRRTCRGTHAIGMRTWAVRCGPRTARGTRMPHDGSWSELSREARRDVWVAAAGRNSGDAIRSCRQSRARTEERYDKALRSSWPDEIQHLLAAQQRCLHDEADELAKLQF